jgi:uncharacterized protein YqeY
MNKYDELKSFYREMRKARDKVCTSILALLLGEVESDMKRGIEPTDANIIKKANKIIDGNRECLKNETNEDKILVLETEIECLSQLTPQMMSDDQLILAIKSVENATNPGLIMKELSSKYAGQYDGKRAFELVKSFLAGES